MTAEGAPPRPNEFELTLFGPGYGESIVLHVGDGNWVIVDSCIDSDEAPAALGYLESIGIDPAKDVALVVATHWHDDHIRGMSHLVEACGNASFCCAAVLCREEFLRVANTRESRHLSRAGSGLREIGTVFSHLRQRGSRPTHAFANRLIYQRGPCKIWALSPGDRVFERFLRALGEVTEGDDKDRTADISPNQVAVALWVDVQGASVLLGSDLEIGGWKEIVENGERPPAMASAFKIPHHGSRNADLQEVWREMLDNPTAVLTPWRRGAGALPSETDVHRILAHTRHAYATARSRSLRASPRHRVQEVRRTIRESGVTLRKLANSTGSIRLRKPIDAREAWQVELFGAACHLEEYRGGG